MNEVGSPTRSLTVISAHEWRRTGKFTVVAVSGPWWADLSGMQGWLKRLPHQGVRRRNHGTGQGSLAPTLASQGQGEGTLAPTLATQGQGQGTLAPTLRAPDSEYPTERVCESVPNPSSGITPTLPAVARVPHSTLLASSRHFLSFEAGELGHS